MEHIIQYHKQINLKKIIKKGFLQHNIYISTEIKKLPFLIIKYHYF